VSGGQRSKAPYRLIHAVVPDVQNAVFLFLCLPCLTCLTRDIFALFPLGYFYASSLVSSISPGLINFID
jgi:hypothetical protein